MIFLSRSPFLDFLLRFRAIATASWDPTVQVPWCLPLSPHWHRVDVVRIYSGDIIYTSWWFGTMEFHDFPFSWECHHPN